MDKRVTLFTVLSAIFLTALILAETTGGKLIQLAFGNGIVFTLTMGVIPFPITFIVTDIINEYYGRKGIRFITVVGMIMVLFALILLQVEMAIPAAAISPVPDAAFNTVFGVSARIILGSLTAYLIGQFVDISVFHAIRRRTKGSMLWLRATGSTIVSQLIDSFVVLFIAFLGPLSAGPDPGDRIHQLPVQIRDRRCDHTGAVPRPCGGGPLSRAHARRRHGRRCTSGHRQSTGAHDPVPDLTLITRYCSP